MCETIGISVLGGLIVLLALALFISRRSPASPQERKAEPSVDEEQIATKRIQ